MKPVIAVGTVGLVVLTACSADSPRLAMINGTATSDDGKVVFSAQESLDEAITGHIATEQQAPCRKWIEGLIRGVAESEESLGDVNQFGQVIVEIRSNENRVQILFDKANP